MLKSIHGLINALTYPFDLNKFANQNYKISNNTVRNLDLLSLRMSMTNDLT